MKIIKLNSKFTDKEKRKYLNIFAKASKRSTGRDVDRLIKTTIAWGSSMIACKMLSIVTGNIRHYAASIEKLKKVVTARW